MNSLLLNAPLKLRFIGEVSKCGISVSMKCFPSENDVADKSVCVCVVLCDIQEIKLPEKLFAFQPANQQTK